ncbi:unnamed protein product [Heterobilharzia americana]|nr:unnamed protein product [Heterobilharzia americana]
MTGFLTPVNCPLATAQLLSCSDKTLPRQSSPFVRQQVQQLPHPPPPLPPKPSQINPKTSIDSQEHLSAEDEEVFKFMSRSFDPNDELSSDFQSLNRKLTDSKQRPLPPPYYVNINHDDDDASGEILLNKRKFPHKITSTTTTISPTSNKNNNKTSQLIKQTATLNHQIPLISGSSTSLNDLRKDEEKGSSSKLNFIQCRKSFGSIEKMKNQNEINQVKAKRYIKQKSEYAFNLREFLKTLHHPVDDLAVKTSDTTALPQSNSGICLTSILGNWITLRTSRAQKPLPAEESLDYFQCKIILTGRICGGYLWIMKKPSRTRNNIWESIKRRVHDSSSTQSTNGENEKINKRIIIRSTSQARWCRKWLSCDMLEQKIFICERKGNGRIDCTINFSIIKVVHQRSTEQLLDSQKSFSLSPRISQRTLYSLVSTDNNNKNDEKETTLHTYFLMAPSPELTRLWMDVLKQAMRMGSASMNTD